jgi:hypothetical protein
MSCNLSSNKEKITKIMTSLIYLFLKHNKRKISLLLDFFPGKVTSDAIIMFFLFSTYVSK